MKTILLAILLACFIQTSKADEWTKEDTYRQVGYLTLHGTDWVQTDRVYDLNPILGHTPSTKRVNIYFLTTSMLHTGISWLLPSEARKAFQIFTIAIEGGVVVQNYQLKISSKF